MASGVTRLSDIIVPAIWTPMVQRLSVERTAIFRSGAAQADPILDNFLAGAGATVNMPRQNPVDTSDVENVSGDDPTVFSTPNKVAQNTEIAVRLNRNNSWSEMDLVRELLDYDPLQALAQRVAEYWAIRRQRAIVAHLTGVFANNAASTDAYHTQNDMTVDLSTLNASSFSSGHTDFTGSAFVDAFATMGDNMDKIALVMMHSIVYAKAIKNGLIVFRNDADASATVPTYMGKDVVLDDMMPSPSSGVYETWLFGMGSIRYGTGTPPVPNEVLRVPSAGNGGGQELMWDRVTWAHHVPGVSYMGTPGTGGPTNLGTSNNLAAAGSWQRQAPVRKMIPIARIVTREF